MNEVIADERVVQIHYTLTNTEGEVLDSSKDGPTMAYLQGAGNLVPGLEREMVGHAIGDKLDVVVPPADGFGERSAEPFAIPRDRFPSEAELHPGLDFIMENDAGEQRPVWVVAADDEKVTVDPNHPLAGLELRFAVEVIAIREATPDELDHGHPHGPGGHH